MENSQNVEIKQHAPERPIGQWKIKGNLRNLETNEDGNTTCQNVWDAAKALLSGQLIVINTFIKKKKDLKETTHLYTSRN